MGVEDLDLVGPHPLLLQVDQHAGQLLQVGLASGRAGIPFGHVGTERGGSAVQFLRPEELAS